MGFGWGDEAGGGMKEEKEDWVWEMKRKIKKKRKN